MTGATKNRQHLTPQILDPNYNLETSMLQKYVPTLYLGVEDLRGQMLPIFGCAPHISPFLSICCWQQFLAAGSLSATPQNTSENAECNQPKTLKPQMGFFRS